MDKKNKDNLPEIFMRVITVPRYFKTLPLKSAISAYNVDIKFVDFSVGISPHECMIEVRGDRVGTEMAISAVQIMLCFDLIVYNRIMNL